MAQIIKNRLLLQEAYGLEVVEYIEEYAPTLVNLINQYRGRFVYDKYITNGASFHSRDETDSTSVDIIKIGTDYIFMPDADVKYVIDGKKYYDLILALAHELGHAVGRYQAKNLIKKEKENKSSPAITYKTAYDYAMARHLGEAEAIYIEYQVAKELGKTDEWKKSDLLHGLMADYMDNKTGSDLDMLKQMAKLHAINAIPAGQIENYNIVGWNMKDYPLEYTYSEQYQAYYLDTFTNLNKDYQEATGENLFNSDGNFLPIHNLEKMAHLKSLVHIPLKESAFFYGATNPDNFKKIAALDKNKQDSLKKDNISNHNLDYTNFVRELRRYQATLTQQNPSLLKTYKLETEIRELMYGGDGNDVIHGSKMSELILGGAGIDYLHANGGNDVLAGNDGHDRLYSGSGNDRLIGGNGYDFYIFNQDTKTGKVGKRGEVDTIFDKDSVNIGLEKEDRDNRGEIILGRVGEIIIKVPLNYTI